MKKSFARYARGGSNSGSRRIFVVCRVAVSLVLVLSFLGTAVPLALSGQAAYAEATLAATTQNATADTPEGGGLADTPAAPAQDTSALEPEDPQEPLAQDVSPGEAGEASEAGAAGEDLEGMATSEELEELEPLETLVPIQPLAVHTYNVASESDLNTAMGNTAGANGDTINIVVTADFSISGSTEKIFQYSKTFTMTSDTPAAPHKITRVNPAAGAYAFRIYPGASLTITDLIIEGTNVGGSLFRVQGTITLGSGGVLQGQTIPAATSVDGAAIRAEDTGAVVNILPGSCIQNNTSSNCGGAIAVGTNSAGAITTFATLNISGGIITNNQTDSHGRTKGGHGGGIWIGYDANVSITGGEINGNTARGMGGGVYLGGTNSTLEMTDVTVEDNTSLLILTAGGNFSAGFGGGVGIAGGAADVKITRCDFYGNTADKAAYNDAIIGGGGAVGISSSQDVYLIDCEITDNHALYSAGGGVRTGSTTGGDVYIQGDTVISDNDADTYGGGIAYDAHTAIYLSDSVEIHDNSAGTTGGGLSTNPATTTTSAEELVLSDDVKIYDNTAGTNGGGIYTVSTTTIKNDASITGNHAVMGGGIAIGSATAGVLTNQVTFSMESGTIEHNETYHPDHRGNHGGGLWIGYKVNAYLSGGSISNNTARGIGGGIYLGGTTSTLTMNGVTMDSNTSLLDLAEPAGTGTAGFGGAVGITGGAAPVSFTNCTFTGNIADKSVLSSAVGGGGAVGINCAVDVYFEDCTLTGNKSLYGAGGAIRTGTSGGGDVYIQGTTEISRNSAYTYGGGIGYDNTTALYVSDSVQMFDNSAGQCGGAIGMDPAFTTGMLLKISDKAKIDHNTAGLDGGGISTASVTTISDSVEITRNTATAGNGGGIYAKAALTVNGPVKFADNTAPYGGAVYGTSTIDIKGTAKFTNNQATATAPSGGAIYPATSVPNSALALSRLTVGAAATFSGNSAPAPSYARLTSDNALYEKNILAPSSAWTSPINPGQGQGYNNFDIAYATFTITVTSGGNGTGSANYSVSCSGTEIDLSALPAALHQFNHWEVVSGGAVLSDPTDPNAIFAMPNANVALKAVFSPDAASDYTITANNDGNGAAVSSVTDAAPGDSVSLTATPSPSFQFNHWEVVSGNATLSSTSDPNATFTMPAANVVVKAYFSVIGANSYYVYVANDGRGAAQADPVNPVPKADLVTLLAAPNVGYAFDYWEVVSGNVVLSDPSDQGATFTMPTADVYLTAHFVKAYTLYISTDGHGVATISHSGGTASTANALDTAGASLQLASVGLSPNALTTLAVGADIVSLSTPAGFTIIHTAQAKQGYVFDSWELIEEGLVDVPMNPADLADPAMASCWCIMPQADIHLVAHFKPAPGNSNNPAPDDGSNNLAPGGNKALPATGEGQSTWLLLASLAGCLAVGASLLAVRQLRKHRFI